MSILLLHAAVTSMMGGLIWFVQVVHYPLFSRVGEGAFADYEACHTVRTGWVVAPLMLTEAATSAVLVFVAPVEWRWLAWVGLAVVAVLWSSTALVQVPCHRRLADGFDESTWRRLVGTNWWRTVLWSLRTVIAFAMLALAAAGGEPG